jgi:hypothetical protein
MVRQDGREGRKDEHCVVPAWTSIGHGHSRQEEKKTLGFITGAWPGEE